MFDFTVLICIDAFILLNAMLLNITINSLSRLIALRLNSMLQIASSSSAGGLYSS